MTASYSSLNLIFLGPPGSGKGTQARIVAERYSITHVSTGDVLRDEVRKDTPLGQEIREVVDDGEQVPDRLLSGIVLARLHRERSSRGFLLDGYPRTVEQARTLDDLLAELGRSIEGVLLFKVPDDVAAERLNGRRVHAGSGRVYHVELDPPQEGEADDLTGESLTQLPEDRSEAIRRRLAIYHQKTAKLVKYYRDSGLLSEVDGNRPKTEVTESVLHLVGAPVGA